MLLSTLPVNFQRQTIIRKVTFIVFHHLHLPLHIYIYPAQRGICKQSFPEIFKSQWTNKGEMKTNRNMYDFIILLFYLEGYLHLPRNRIKKILFIW